MKSPLRLHSTADGDRPRAQSIAAASCSRCDRPRACRCRCCGAHVPGAPRRRHGAEQPTTFTRRARGLWRLGAPPAPYGEVWVPDGVPRGWRPYEYGHWVYTDEWGWYWVSDDEEDDWGWVAYHYGRWASDRSWAWFWVPGDEWAPAWVDWRYGDDYIGWAPLPPDDLIDAYDDQPDYWVFVALRYIGEPRAAPLLPAARRRASCCATTRIINRPVHVEGRRVAVNPGIAAGFHRRPHARAAARLQACSPRVFGAHARRAGAVAVRSTACAQRARSGGSAAQRAAHHGGDQADGARRAAPQPLAKGERGQLGSHPPRAAQGGARANCSAEPRARRRHRQRRLDQPPPARRRHPRSTPPPSAGSTAPPPRHRRRRAPPSHSAAGDGAAAASAGDRPAPPPASAGDARHRRRSRPARATAAARTRHRRRRPWRIRPRRPWRIRRRHRGRRPRRRRSRPDRRPLRRMRRRRLPARSAAAEAGRQAAGARK